VRLHLSYCFQQVHSKLPRFVGIVTLVGTLAATQINRACAPIAHSEVREILKDDKRRHDVEAVLYAL